jgi:hypothetical protein
LFWWLGCRIYATAEGLKGSPMAETLREALAARGGAAQAVIIALMRAVMSFREDPFSAIR